MDGVVGVHPVPGGGADDRLEGGAQVRPPGGAEAASDLAVHHHRPKITLAAVVVRRRVGVLEKGEQAVTHREVALAQAQAAVLRGWCSRASSSATRAVNACT